MNLTTTTSDNSRILAARRSLTLTAVNGKFHSDKLCHYNLQLHHLHYVDTTIDTTIDSTVDTTIDIPSPGVCAQPEPHIVELAGLAVAAPVLAFRQHAPLLVLLYGLQIFSRFIQIFLVTARQYFSHLNFQIFEDVYPAPAAEVGRGAGEGVLLQLQVAQRHHEPEQIFLVAALNIFRCSTKYF